MTQIKDGYDSQLKRLGELTPRLSVQEMQRRLELSEKHLVESRTEVLKARDR